MIEEGKKALKEKAKASLYELSSLLNSSIFNGDKVLNMFKGMTEVVNEYCKFYAHAEEKTKNENTKTSKPAAEVKKNSRNTFKGYFKVKIENEKPTPKRKMVKHLGTQTHQLIDEASAKQEINIIVRHIIYVILFFLLFKIHQSFFDIIDWCSY